MIKRWRGPPLQRKSHTSSFVLTFNCASYGGSGHEDGDVHLIGPVVELSEGPVVAVVERVADIASGRTPLSLELHCQSPLQDRELLPIEEDPAGGPIRLLVAVTGLCSLASSKSRIRAARLSCVIGFWIIATPASSRPWWTMAFRE
jgi:hypothetical protein